MEHNGAAAEPLWTGGVVSHILEASFMIWHGSQQRITFLNNLNSSDADDKPKGKNFTYCHSGGACCQFHHKLWWRYMYSLITKFHGASCIV